MNVHYLVDVIDGWMKVEETCFHGGGHVVPVVNGELQESYMGKARRFLGNGAFGEIVPVTFRKLSEKRLEVELEGRQIIFQTIGKPLPYIGEHRDPDFVYLLQAIDSESLDQLLDETGYVFI